MSTIQIALRDQMCSAIFSRFVRANTFGVVEVVDQPELTADILVLDESSFHCLRADSQASGLIVIIGDLRADFAKLWELHPRFTLLVEPNPLVALDLVLAADKQADATARESEFLPPVREMRISGNPADWIPEFDPADQLFLQTLGIAESQ